MLVHLVARSRGFTVVEVVITMGIAALALGLGAPAFRVWLENVQVRTVAESIQNGLQVARAEALRGNCNATFALSTDTSWTVTATCPDLTTNAITTKTIQSRGARDGSSSNVAVTLDPGGAVVVFNGMGRVDNASPLTKVDVASSAGTKALRIDIGGGGQVRMCDPGVSAANDPRKCK